MYLHHIEGMARKINEQFPGQDNLNFIRQQLYRYWQDKIADVWTADDVLTYANDHFPRVELTDDDAVKIVNEMFHLYNPEVGLNWDVLHTRIEEYIEDKEETR